MQIVQATVGLGVLHRATCKPDIWLQFGGSADGAEKSRVANFPEGAS